MIFAACSKAPTTGPLRGACLATLDQQMLGVFFIDIQYVVWNNVYHVKQAVILLAPIHPCRKPNDLRSSNKKFITPAAFRLNLSEPISS